MKPFIPSWLDDAGLSPSEMRVFVHLLRSADNHTGIAWPSYRRMIEKCQMGKSTIRRCIEELENRKLIAKAGKPFGGSCRYRLLAIVPPQGLLNDSNSATTGTIDSAPIVPPQDRNSPSDGTSIVPPQGQEGYPLRFSNKGNSPEGVRFAEWFKSTLPQDQQERLQKNWLTAWCKTHDQLLRIDKRTPEEIDTVCRWARADSFWSKNFRSPAKLRERDKQGTLYFDVLTEWMKQPATNGAKPEGVIIAGGRAFKS